MKNVEIRPSELNKVPVYTQELTKVVERSKNIGLENSLKEWARQIKKRRLEWFEKNKDNLHLEGTEVKQAFQLIIIEYMGINPKETPIVEEKETKITWQAFDFCPYYEAIKNSGLKTRDVCKFATEMPVQALLDAFKPGRFHYSRNYEKIRPHTEFCEETIELIE